MAQKYSMKGILRGVEITEGSKKDGSSWKRASLKIEKDGKSSYVATFDEKDIDKANPLNGKEVEVVYTKSEDGKYKNLVSGQIKQVGQGEAPVTEEEIVEDTSTKDTAVQEEVIKEEPVNTPAPTGGTSPDDQRMTKADWANKDKRSYRAMAISYSKDLVIGGKLEKDKMKSTAQEMYEFIWDGYTEDLPASANGDEKKK